MRLKGKVALVTGAGRNIGRAIALGIAAQGGDVIVNTRRSWQNIEAVAREAEALGARALPILADMEDEASVRRMVHQGIEQLGKIDILVNNAVQRIDKAFLNLPFDDWKKTINMNLNGMFHCIQAVLPNMIEHKWGRIISFSGIAASAGFGGKTAIGTVKGGVIGFTKCLAREVGPYGITVNSVSPGDVDVIRDPDYGGGNPWRNYPKTVALTALGRIGTSEEVASLCVYLCMPEAGYITGQNLHVNGGAYM